MRRAKRAILKAGFVSGRFKPKGPDLRIDVWVPITFLDATFLWNDEAMREHVWEQVRGMCLANKERQLSVVSCQTSSQLPVVSTDNSPTDNQPHPTPYMPFVRKPSDMRTKAGREWKRLHEGEAVSQLSGQAYAGVGA